MMIIYLVQPYLEKDIDEDIEVNQAVKIVAGQDNKLYLSTDNYDTQDVPPDYDYTNPSESVACLDENIIGNSGTVKSDKKSRTASHINEGDRTVSMESY